MTSLAHLLLPSAPGLCGGQQRSQCLVAPKQEGDAFGVGKERAQDHLCAPDPASDLSNTSSTLSAKATAHRTESGSDGENGTLHRARSELTGQATGCGSDDATW